MLSASMSSGKLSSRIPQPQFGRRASASAIMESSTRIDSTTLSRLNASFDAAVKQQQSSARTDAPTAAGTKQRRNSLQRNHSMYERKSSLRQPAPVVEKLEEHSKDTSKLPKKSGLNPMSKFHQSYYQ